MLLSVCKNHSLLANQFALPQVKKVTTLRETFDSSQVKIHTTFFKPTRPEKKGRRDCLERKAVEIHHMMNLTMQNCGLTIAFHTS